MRGAILLPVMLAASGAPAPRETAAVAVAAPGAASAVAPSATHVTPVASTDLQQAADGLFYVEALVNGAPVRFVVDTGASMVMLTKADAARSGIDPGRADLTEVQTAGGSTSMRRVRLDQVVVAGSHIANVDAAIIGDSIGVSLLGQTVLSRLDSVRMTGRRLRLN